MKIKVGHLIRVFHENDTWEGVVVKIDDHTDNEYLSYVNLHIYDALNRIAYKVCTPKAEYKEGEFRLVFIREVEMHHTLKLLEQYENFHEAPEAIEPNKKYGNGIEVYVRTKKNWFPLERTTAKMAFYGSGQRCAISNITDIRRK